jgi:hypothetical protein
LIDVGLEDALDQSGLSSVNLLDDFDGPGLIDSFDNAGGMPAQSQNLPQLGSGLPVASGLPAASGFDFVQSGNLGGGLPVACGLPAASGFDFLQGGNQGGYAPPPAASMSGPTLAATGSSAFGFIASSSEGPKLDLAALYASSEPPKAKAQMSDFSALSGSLAEIKAPVPATFDSLEKSILSEFNI